MDILVKLNNQIDILASEAQAKIDKMINQFEKDYDRNINNVFFYVIIEKHMIDYKRLPSECKFKFAEIL